ncbi:lipocalin family protein [Paraglaciecola chathamensis]|uniref:Outer membrane lipoprotein Blc n=1 Tax=Paraglaciecola agarilytica NO2 TaxID=1125747 RepID=A0ABQ0I6Y2_9ALTE|nr:lipocalin family protein [Paraglaciecola agarilytica]GAC04829.1 outer membrane lipoprotein Blc [Paraglaciecola agarilytica NO2]
MGLPLTQFGPITLLLKSKNRLVFLFVALLLTGCTSVPSGIEPVQDFNLQRYLGKWYEVARYDHSFERGLEQVTAQYSLRNDGGVKVVNRGFNQQEQAWEEAVGKAYFVDDESTGHLKVSFFGPFYASYVIFSLDIQDYDYAMITGPNRDYLWILARQPKLPPEVMQNLLEKAGDAGFDTQKLIFVDH